MKFLKNLSSINYSTNFDEKFKLVHTESIQNDHVEKSMNDSSNSSEILSRKTDQIEVT